MANRRITTPTVTGNAQLLCGVVATRLIFNTDDPNDYSVIEADAENGKLIVRSPMGNLFVVKIRQIEGME